VHAHLREGLTTLSHAAAGHRVVSRMDSINVSLSRLGACTHERGHRQPGHAAAGHRVVMLGLKLHPRVNQLSP
jgi:hypothetical protein